MKASLLLAALLTPAVVPVREMGALRPEGYCLDKKALVLTQAEHKRLVSLAARPADDAARITELKAGAVKAKRSEAAGNESEGAALEGQAVCLVAECPPAPVCDCSEWTAGFAGVGAGAVVCAAAWAGSAL